MPKVTRYQHFMDSVGSLTSMAACEHLIEAAFRDYLCYRHSDAEYSAVYFAYVPLTASLSSLLISEQK